jgi:hypothetical protein
MYPHSWFCPYPTPGVAPRPDVSTGLGTQRKGFGSFAGIPGVKPPKPPMMSEPFLALALPFSKNCSKAIRESDFYRDSVAIGMGSEIIGPFAPRSSEKRTNIIGLHRDHRSADSH